ncbi:MAG: MmcQ/YjbR family DNA-binding protein [Anaerolineae bacterium]|nr:MmcQ/YjbR family DNA-binding protein [Anaerolineae bacterium]
MSEKQLERVRRICFTLPAATERLSHGESTFFVRKRVFAMFANNHHDDGRIAVWLPAPPGIQEMLISSSPETYFKPPYVGVRGWIGIQLDNISDEDLIFHIRDGWWLVAPKKLQAIVKNSEDIL